MYYLNSRYYNPEWCRFINADGIINANQDIYSLNMYSYTCNNPIVRIDPKGKSWGVAILGGALSGGIGAGAVIGAGMVVVGGLLLFDAAYSYYVDNVYTRPQTTRVSDKVNKNKSKNNKKKERNNVVYGLYDSERNIQYAGRTNNQKRREAAHNRNPLKKDLTFRVLVRDLTLDEARITEQTIIAKCNTLNRTDIRGWNNKINSIGPSGSLYSQFIDEYEDTYNHITKINPNGVCKWKE